MSEQLRYDDELKRGLGNLPLPDEDMAWSDMERRLDKGDDRKPMLPPVLRGCAAMGLLLLVLGIAALVWVNPFNWLVDQPRRDSDTTNATNEIQLNTKKDSNNLQTSPINNNDEIGSVTDSTTTNPIIAKPAAPGEITAKISAGNSASSSLRRQGKKIPFDRDRKLRSTNQFTKNKPGRNEQVGRQAVSRRSSKGRLSSSVSGKAEEMQEPVDTSAISIDQPGPLINYGDSLLRKTVSTIVPKDTAKKLVDDTTVAGKNSESNPKEKRALYFGAGVGLHQLIPIAGQRSTPYSASGRKNSLGDYIPSVYLRLYKEKRWFIQSEFRYGAPQYTREQVFSQAKSVDSSGVYETVNNSSVKKTFYHQLPLSFNYFVLPGLSIGAGISYNRFSSAVVQQESYQRNIASQVDSFRVSTIEQHKGVDTNFAKSYFQGLFELQYQRKRLSTGMRYSFGLQPYLIFTLPGAQQSREKNSAFQFFIRYELWRSKKK